MRITDSEMNRLLVLKTIRRSQPVARTDLAKSTQLAGGTITQLTADFMRQGILLEEKAPGMASGRPKMELRINAAAAHAISVIPLPNNRLSIQIIDLKGDPVFSSESSIERAKTLEDWARRLAATVAEAINASPLAKKQIHRVGVVVHGVVDNVRGVVHWLSSFPDTDVPVASIMERLLHIPVVIDNDANVIARAEHWFGEEGQLDDFSVIVVNRGLNCAHYVDGLPWTGAHGINPEFGHTKMVVAGGRPCYCGGAGCLGAYAAIFGIVSQACELRGAKMPSQRKMIGIFREFAAQARDGDEKLQDIFSMAGRMLGTAAANMINERDPGRVLVVAFEPDLISMISEGFSSALRANTLPALSGRAEVQLKLIDADQYRKGTAALALEQIYRS